MTTVLVTGATGAIGTQLVPALRQRGVHVRAFVRDRGKGSGRLGPDVDLAVGDFIDPSSLATALTGVDRVFINSADGPDKVAHESAVIDAAAKAGVDGIVKLSTVGAQPGSPLPGLDWHGHIEDHLSECGRPAVVLRANFLMANLLAARDAILHGQLPAPAGTGRVSMIDPRDVIDVAAAVLTADRFRPDIHVLTGGQAVTYHDAAAAISGATGRQVLYVDLPEDTAVQAWTAAGLPPWLVRHLTGAFRLIRDGALAEVTNTVTTLTGQPPRTVSAFAADQVDLVLSPGVLDEDD
jgi:uncharacterized protein YbjT (DUF2867 family)